MSYGPPRLERRLDFKRLDTLESLDSEPDVIIQVTDTTQTHGFAVSRKRMAVHSKYFTKYFATAFAEGIAIDAAVQAIPSGLSGDARLAHLPRIELIWQPDVAKTLRAVNIWLPLLHAPVVSSKQQKQSLSTKPTDKPEDESTFAQSEPGVLLSKASLKTLIMVSLLSEYFESIDILAYGVRMLLKSKTPGAVKALFANRTLSRTDAGRLDPDSKDADTNAETGENHFTRKIVWLSYLLDLHEPFRQSTHTLMLNELFDYNSLHALLCDIDPETNTPSDALDLYLSTRPSSPPWRNLPFEAELLFRQHALATMVLSIPQFYLDMYIAGLDRDTICKMHYGSSRACDSFQLGVMSHALYKARLFEPIVRPVLRGRSAPTTELAIHADTSVGETIALLRSTPAEQLDKHHQNCGLRALLSPRLEAIEQMLAKRTAALVLSEVKALRHWMDCEPEETWTWKTTWDTNRQDEDQVRKMAMARSWAWSGAV